MCPFETQAHHSWLSIQESEMLSTGLQLSQVSCSKEISDLWVNISKGLVVGGGGTSRCIEQTQIPDCVQVLPIQSSAERAVELMWCSCRALQFEWQRSGWLYETGFAFVEDLRQQIRRYYISCSQFEALTFWHKLLTVLMALLKAPKKSRTNTQQA